MWRNRDAGSWQVPKGRVEREESDEAAARREVAEELGVMIREPLASLGEIRQAGGKIVVAFPVERDLEPSDLVSNPVEIVWPPRSGRKLIVPEIDEVRWFDFEMARHCIVPSQLPLIEALDRLLGSSAA